MKQLLFSITKDDFDITFFSGSGAGGQHRNRHRNCVRLKHRESGAIVTGQSNRHLRANMREALHGLLNNGKFRMWHAKKVREVCSGQTTEQAVAKAMEPQNLKVEVRDQSGQWTQTK